MYESKKYVKSIVITLLVQGKLSWIQIFMLCIVSLKLNRIDLKWCDITVTYRIDLK